MRPDPRCVLCLSGHDPGGGAGLQADIETLSSQGVHAFGVITALTVQDSRNVQRVIPVDAELLREQIDCLLADRRPDVIKIGLIGDSNQLPLLIETIRVCGVPVVLDPVLRAGGGQELVPNSLAMRLVQELLPLVTVLTPNAAEARRLAPASADLAAAGTRLVAAGCAHVLVTGGDESGPTVVNVWHQRGQAQPQSFEWPRLPETFHGAGCTLASAIAARLALGDDIGTALLAAQMWTQAALANARATGRGRRIPWRKPI